jgi:hypothetical protein
VLFAEVVNFIQTRSRERLRSDARVPPFSGTGLPSRPTSPASAGFFCGGASPDFPLGFPSFISDSGLWPTNLAPRVARMIDANQPSKNIPSGELIHPCPRSLAENGRGGEASGRFRVRQLIPSAVAQDPGCMVYNEAFKMR